MCNNENHGIAIPSFSVGEIVMKIVIPMAGLGERFRRAGYTDPKPMIKIDGKPIIDHIVSMFSKDDDFVFICNDEHLKINDIEKTLKKLAPKSKIIYIKQHKLGPVWTVLEALKKDEFLDDNDPVVINYCDFGWSWNYKDFLGTLKKTKCDAAVTAYKGFHPPLLGPGLYASMRTDDKNWMLECREKFSFTENKMDSFQQSGTFYFAKGKFVKKFFDEVVKNNIAVNGEYYISVVTEAARQSGLKVYVYPLKYFLQWGTPEDLQTYQFWSDYFRKI